ncbi:hypothetical protein [Methylobacterium sp. sgz302541]|uniref:hypothetical protein n=1 Tax=unclassified Methylobacterium TaxID=2615210 RepID=UPI003D33138C
MIRLVGSAVSVSGRDPTIKSEDVPDVGSVSYYVQGASAALADPEAESLLQPYRRLLFA